MQTLENGFELLIFLQVYPDQMQTRKLLIEVVIKLMRKSPVSSERSFDFLGFISAFLILFMFFVYLLQAGLRRLKPTTKTRHATS